MSEPEWPSTGNILAGTASWTDKTLIKSGRFYPKNAKTPEDRLRFYASKFPVVEVDSSYYGLPAVDNSIKWSKRTPAGFTFDIKAFRVFTLHQTPLDSIPAELRDDVSGTVNERGNVYYEGLDRSSKDRLWELFEEGIKPLKDDGKLGYVLLQFPPWVMKRRSNLEHIAECADRLDGYTLAIEFRNRTWMEDGERREVLAVLREQNLALVTVDEPQGFASSIPPVWEVTSPDLAVVRFHGRNEETWTKKSISAAERFNYLYSEDEMQEFVEPVRELAEQSRQVHAIFNNCYEDYGQQNAQQLMMMLAAA